MNYFNTSINATTYSLNNATAASGDYHEAYSYDGNGNILTLDRRGYYSSGQDEMDSLVYFYESGKNRLNYIRDTVPAGNYSVDLDSQTPNNYSYDESGNLISDAKEKLSAVTWSPYGKIKNIAKSLDTVNIAYSYDASMNRVLKKYTSASDTIKTYYIRDAQGNVLAVYTIDNDSLRWAEQHLYGSTRLGLIEKDLFLNSATVNINKPGSTGLVFGIKRNARRYELTNHLGNVLSVISDVKRPKTESSNTFYDVDRIAVNDYYPFGMQMPGRKLSLDTYRYGFNGKENDNEVKGEGNQQDYGFRIYDPRVGRFLSVDPISAQYPELTPYQFASNRPIDGVDMDGLEFEFYYTKFGNWVNGKLELKVASVVTNDKAIQLKSSLTTLKVPLSLLGINKEFVEHDGFWKELPEGYSKENLPDFYSDIWDNSLTYEEYKDYFETAANSLLTLNPSNVKASSSIIIKKVSNLKYLRSKAVSEAWKLEKELVKKTGSGTHQWMEEEKAELLKTGKVKGYVGHHIKSVKGNEALAGNPANIKFVKGQKGNLAEHGGNFRNPTKGPLIDRKKMIDNIDKKD